jgi:aryl-alcohol dehydrogenase-like predicted oxidoreductase
MEQRNIGGTSLRASALGLGCNNFGLSGDVQQTKTVVHQALDSGVTYFDMASEHRRGLEEELVAQALGDRRKDVIIATKVGQPELIDVDRHGNTVISTDEARRGLSRRWIFQSIEESLKRLNTDYIDLYQPHATDETVPREETLRAFEDLIQQGKVRAIGEATTFANLRNLETDRQLADKLGLKKFVAVETQYNLMVRDAERELIPWMAANRLSLIPYFPLANGLLTDKYRNGTIPAGSRFEKFKFASKFHGAATSSAKIERVRGFAAERGYRLVDVAISWLLSKPVVASVIAGATSAEQVVQNAQAAQFKLSAAECAALDALSAD